MSGSSSSRDRVAAVVDALGRQYGPLEWWAAPPEEVMVGAVLVQQTRWENIRPVIAALREAGLLSLAAIDRTPTAALEAAIRPTGFFRVKARRLKALARFVVGVYGSVEAMARAGTDELRRGLLSINGVGEETADAILCYAFSRCSFVLDAYTRRIMACAGVEEPPGGFRPLFEAVLPRDNARYRETHAHIVEHAKRECSRRRCDGCSIRSLNA